MASTATNPRQQAHELIDRLAPSQVSAMVSLIATMLDPVARAIANAPVDEETLTPECAKSLDEASEWFTHNKGIPHEQVLSELGITQEEIEQYQAPK